MIKNLIYQQIRFYRKFQQNFKHYFFRGISDGDGNFYYNRKVNTITSSISSSYIQDWNYIQKECDNLNIKAIVSLSISKKGHKSSHIRMQGLNCKLFGDFIYIGVEKDNIGLKRKYNKCKYCF